jgi:hypothetical protein
VESNVGARATTINAKKSNISNKYLELRGGDDVKRRFQHHRLRWWTRLLELESILDHAEGRRSS